MKKIFCVILMLSVTVCALFGQNGVIRDLLGDVELKPAGASAFEPAKSGDTVSQDTIVSTGFKSTAIIEIGSSVITVRPLTRLSLAEIQTSSGEEDLNVNLHTGRIKVDVKPPAGVKTHFTVKSPSATASVRGTSFEFDTLNLNVHEGTVAFTGIHGAVTMVADGESGSVAPDGTSAATAEILPSTPVGTPKEIEIGQPPESDGGLSIELNYNNN